MEECDEKLRCKCNGFAHMTCIQEWMAARVQRGDSMPDVVRCELCKSLPAVVGATAASSTSTNDPDSSRVCSWLRCRILGIATAIIACIVTVCVYSITLIIPDIWGGMVGVMVIAVIVALFIIIRVLLDPRCIHACLCHDLAVLEEVQEEA